MKKNTVYYALAALVCAIFLTIIGWRYYIRTIEKNEWGELGNNKEYTHHYAMIPDDSDSELWQDIYQSARRKPRVRVHTWSFCVTGRSAITIPCHT